MVTRYSIAIVGDSWSALLCAGHYAARFSADSEGEGSNLKILWVGSRAAQFLPVLPTFDASVQGWKESIEELARTYEIGLGELRSGSLMRDYRNRSFQEAVWSKAPNPEAREETKSEILWEPECRFAPGVEAHFDKPLAQIQEELRDKVLACENITRVEGVSLKQVQETSDSVLLKLADGTEHLASHLVYADRWMDLHSLEGFPESLTYETDGGKNKKVSRHMLNRTTKPCGILQVKFTHDRSVGEGLEEGFSLLPQKDSKDKEERRIWGYFLDGGKTSVWSFLLRPEEAEDNQQISRRFKRMKTTLNRTFPSSQWLSDAISSKADDGRETQTSAQLDQDDEEAGQNSLALVGKKRAKTETKFCDTVIEETLVFEDEAFFGKDLGITHPIIKGRVAFLTDGFGISNATMLAGRLFSSFPEEEIQQAPEIVPALSSP